VFASGAGEAIGDQDERPVGERHALGLSQGRVEDGPEPELVEQSADSQNWPPSRGIENIEIVFPRRPRVGIVAEQASQLGEHLRQQVHAAQIGEGALLDLAIVAIGFDDADILVDRAAGGPDFDSSEIHVVKYHDVMSGNQAKNWANFKKSG